MSTFVIFAIGSVIFAITVYGAVMVGGLKLTKASILENEQYRRRVDDDQVKDGLPTDATF